MTEPRRTAPPASRDRFTLVDFARMALGAVLLVVAAYLLVYAAAEIQASFLQLFTGLIGAIAAAVLIILGAALILVSIPFWRFAAPGGRPARSARSRRRRRQTDPAPDDEAIVMTIEPGDADRAAEPPPRDGFWRRMTDRRRATSTARR